MCGGTPNAPTPPPATPEAPTPPAVSGADGQADRDRRRRASASGQGGRSTILTSSRGVQDGAATATKTLLGE